MKTSHDLDAWLEIPCAEADTVRGRGAITPGSSLTDLDGQYGEPVIYTEWRNAIGSPVLRDYLWYPHRLDAWCAHYIPKREQR